MIDKDLAARLKSYRNFKHLTQKEVAKYLKVPHSAISDIENGKRDITVGELRIFSNLYGRSVEEIMSGKKYDYYNIANIARLLTELPDEGLLLNINVNVMKKEKNKVKISPYFSIFLNSSNISMPSSKTFLLHSSKVML